MLSAHAELLPVQATAEEGAGCASWAGRAFRSSTKMPNTACAASKRARNSPSKHRGSATQPALPRVRLKTRAEPSPCGGRGASVYLSALAAAEVELFEEREFEYVTGGGLVTKREELHFYSGASLLGRDGDGRRIRDGLFGRHPAPFLFGARERCKMLGGQRRPRRGSQPLHPGAQRGGARVARTAHPLPHRDRAGRPQRARPPRAG